MNQVPRPVNEPVRAYAPGSAERKELKAALAALRAQPTEVPLFIGGQPVTAGKPARIPEPHDHERTLGRASQADAFHVGAAIEAAAKAAPELVARCPWRSAPPSSCAPPTCWPGRGAHGSTRPPCWARARPRTRPRSTRPAS